MDRCIDASSLRDDHGAPVSPSSAIPTASRFRTAAVSRSSASEKPQWTSRFSSMHSSFTSLHRFCWWQMSDCSQCSSRVGRHSPRILSHLPSLRHSPDVAQSRLPQRMQCQSAAEHLASFAQSSECCRRARRGGGGLRAAAFDALGAGGGSTLDSAVQRMRGARVRAGHLTHFGLESGAAACRGRPGA